MSNHPKVVTVNWGLIPKWFYEFLFGVQPVGVVKSTIGKSRLRGMSYVAPLTFSWPAATGLKAILATLTVNAAVQPVQTLDPTATSLVLPQVKAGDVYHLSLVAEGNFENSVPTVFDIGPIPDLTPPSPIGAITGVIGQPVQIPDVPIPA